jgi:hypothetical protein
LISCGELQLAPVPRWGDAGDAAENGSEMLLVLEAHTQSNVKDREFRIPEHLLALFDA